MNDNKVIATPADGVTVLEIDQDQLEALEKQVLDARGRQTPQPASVYAQYDRLVVGMMCVRNGIYGLVTHELVEFIREHIAGRTALEIGAGDGVLAKALDISAVDNHMQEWSHIRKTYQALNQAPIKYGRNVERMDGVEAVVKYEPQVIVCNWLTHKWQPEEPERKGNMYGPDERYLLANCETLIFIGNTSTHANHRLLDKTHLSWQHPWLYSRGLKGKDFVGVWKGGKAR